MRSIKHHILVLGNHKTIATARKNYFWPGMKKDIAEYIARFIKCQQVKVEHQHPVGLLQPFQVPEWKWEVISMDFYYRIFSDYEEA